MKRAYRVQIEFDLRTEADIDSRRVASAVREEWNLDEGISSSTLPLGPNHGYLPVNYGDTEIRVRKLRRTDAKQ